MGALVQLHYLTMLLSGFNIFMLVRLLLRYAGFRKRGIPGLNYTLLLVFVGLVFSLLATLGLLLPEGPLLSVIALFFSSFGLLVNTLFALTVINLVGDTKSWLWRHQRWFVWICLAVLLLYLTNGLHHWMITSVTKQPDGFLYTVGFGAGAVAVSVYSVLLTFVAIVHIFHSGARTVMKAAWIRWVMVGSTLLSAFFNLLENVSPVMKEISIVSSTVWIPVAIICYLFFGYLTTARHMALDLVDDAYVAFDLNGYCVDINPEGARFFERYAGSPQPRAGALAALVGMEDLTGFTPRQIRLNDGKQDKYYQVDAFHLSSGLNQHCGNGYIAREITEYIDRVSELNTMATQDPLTGAKNRRYIMEHGEAYFTADGRLGQPVAVMMVDIDHFKKVNDTYGHPVGDEILVEVRRILQGSVRENDIVVRYGGEEFLVLCSGIDGQVARQVAERIRAGVADKAFNTAAGPLHITVSVGLVAEVPGQGDTLARFIEQADQNMYAAKNSGRNRVV